MGGPLGWGLVGSRGYAATACAPAFDLVADARLVGVVGRDPKRAQVLAASHGAGFGTDDLDSLLVLPELDAVWIASPTYLHHDQAAAALRAGKHVLLEKPLATTAKDAWDLVELAREAERVLATGYQARYVPGHQTARRVIAEGMIGEVTAARSYFGIHRSTAPSPWRQQREYARWGALGDIGTHHVDLLRMLVGEITEAAGFGARRRGYETEDVFAASLRFESGAVGTLTVDANVWHEATSVEVFGTHGAVTAIGTSPRGAGTVTLQRREHKDEDITGPQPLAWVAQLDAVTRAAQGADIPYATGVDGARNIEILETLLP